MNKFTMFCLAACGVSILFQFGAGAVLFAAAALLWEVYYP